MTDRPSTTVEQDVATLKDWRSDPAALRALVEEHDFLRSESDARDYVDSLLRGLEDIARGRVTPHEQVVRLARERRRDHRSAAAE